MVLSGPDVSHHQGAVNWTGVRNAGHFFCWCKATEGVSFRDSRYPTNKANSRSAGLIHGAYHFLRVGDGAAQARFFLSTTGGPDGIMCALDVESALDGSNPTISDCNEFANEFWRLTNGHPLVVYTGHWYWVGRIGNPRGAHLGALWHSEYEPNPSTGPDLDRYGGWTGALFWQWTSSGSCPGISGRCDLNVFYGDQTDLLRLTTSQPLPQPPPPEEDDMITVIAANGGVAPRYWTALMDGYVRIFNLWDPGPASESNPLGIDHQTVWCPNSEYERGVGTVYKPVQFFETGSYDNMVATAKRTVYPAP